MTTSYVDVNALNSRIERDTNNVFTYQLPESVELPTGTEISVQNALINLQGITGASIEIEADIEETILFQYYMSDSQYQTPNKSVNSKLNDITRFNIYSNISRHFNGTEQFEFNAGSAYKPIPTNVEVIDDEYGFSENILPAVCPAIWNGSEASTIPMCGEADIKIKKGVYSISKLASIISDQINFVTNPNNENNTTIDRKLKGTYKGLFYNQTTNRGVKVEQNNYWGTYHSSGVPPAGLTAPNELRPFTSDDVESISMLCVTGDFNEKIRKTISVGMWGDDQDALEKINNFFPQTVPDAQRRYTMVFDQENNNDGTYNGDIYNVFSQNTMGIGTSSFNVGFSTEESAFTIQNLHEPRRLPTHDKFGNVVKNSGQSAAYSQRPLDDAAIFNEGQLSTLNTFVQRYSGVSVYNWAWRACRKFGLDWSKKMVNNNTTATAPPGSTQAQVDQYIENASKFARFSEFFSNEKDANNVWKTTIWARLGFKYTDIQAPESFTKQKFFNEVNETINGFTTRQETDSSALPYISTLFNGAQGGVGSTEAPKAVGSQIEPLPQSIASIQLFNLQDVNVPKLGYNNNKNINAGIACVAPYQASFYTNAVMIPIQTKGKDVSATGLPILSRNGYLYILSDIIDQDDIVKFKDNVGLLDQLPKSNLSNQDFISDRTAITHILSAPKIINEIRIMILNPDLTDVDLQRSSSVLLRITRPQQKQSIFQANVVQNFEENEESVALGKAEEVKEKNLEKEKKALGIAPDPQPLPPTTASDIAVAVEAAVQTEEAQAVRKESRTVGFQAAGSGSTGAFTRRGRPTAQERARVTADQPQRGERVITPSREGMRRLREESRRGTGSGGAEDGVGTQTGAGRGRGRPRGRPAEGRARPPSPAGGGGKD